MAAPEFQVSNCIGKSTENMLLAINKHRKIMLWHLCIWHVKRCNILYPIFLFNKNKLIQYFENILIQ